MENVDRAWMYDRSDGRGAIKSSCVSGVDNFLQFARSQRHRMSGQNIKCPCKRCKNIHYLALDTVRLHLFQVGFIENYFIWIYHGEKAVISETTACAAQPERGSENPYRQIVQQQTQAQSKVNQVQEYYEAAGGGKKRRVCDLGSQAKSYYGQNLRVSSGSDASSSVSSSNAQSIPTEELLLQLIPTLTDRILPVFTERVKEIISPPQELPTTPTDLLSSVAPN